MCVAVFDKYKSIQATKVTPAHCITRVTDNSWCMLIGRKDHNIVELPLVKLKAIYKFLEQLYVGGLYCIIAVKNTKAPPHYIMDMLK